MTYLYFWVRRMRLFTYVTAIRREASVVPVSHVSFSLTFHNNKFCFREKITVMTLINPDNVKTEAVNGGPNTAIKVRTPKRILHFSDGVLEEYSTDEELDNPPKEEQAIVDPNTLTWGPWFWYKTWRAGATTLEAIDTVGEYLAALFGITTPKYYFELEEYRRREAELKAQQEQGWTGAATDNIKLNEVKTAQPKPENV